MTTTTTTTTTTLARAPDRDRRRGRAWYALLALPVGAALTAAVYLATDSEVAA